MRRVAVAATLLLAGCASVHREVPDRAPRIGRPYSVGAQTYVPYDDRGYDRIGEASWYGTHEQGRPTASGERFDKRRVSAAHTTLPLPSYVEVTRLDTGDRMLVRVNDRGPFARGRVIDLSREAARALGVDRDGHALVRVRRVQPTRGQAKRLRRGYAVMLSRVTPTASRLGNGPTPALPPYPALTSPTPTPAYPSPTYASPVAPPLYMPPAPTPSSRPPSRLRPPVGMAPSDFGGGATPAIAGPMVVVATPADPDAADALATALSADHAVVQASGGGYRVVTGPYPDAATRDEALARLRARGYQGAVALDAHPTQP